MCSLSKGELPSQVGSGDTHLPVDYNEIYPELNGYIMRPLLVNPPMCTLKELNDGTYSLYDIEMMHQIIEIRAHQSQPPPEQFAQH